MKDKSIFKMNPFLQSEAQVNISIIFFQGVNINHTYLINTKERNKNKLIIEDVFLFYKTEHPFTIFYYIS